MEWSQRQRQSFFPPSQLAKGHPQCLAKRRKTCLRMMCLPSAHRKRTAAHKPVSNLAIHSSIRHPSSIGLDSSQSVTLIILALESPTIYSKLLQLQRHRSRTLLFHMHFALLLHCHRNCTSLLGCASLHDRDRDDELLQCVGDIYAIALL